MLSLFTSSSDGDGYTTEMNEGIVLMAAILLVLLPGIMAFLFGSQVYIFRWETDFLLPKPISKHSLIMFRFVTRLGYS